MINVSNKIAHSVRWWRAPKAVNSLGRGQGTKQNTDVTLKLAYRSHSCMQHRRKGM